MYGLWSGCGWRFRRWFHERFFLNDSILDGNACWLCMLDKIFNQNIECSGRFEGIHKVPVVIKIYLRISGDTFLRAEI